MKRHQDWQVRFEAFTRERRNMPFAWGSNDCALFAADAVQALTGERVCPELRGHRDEREGVRVLSSLGGVRALATAALGDPIPTTFANVGDIVVVRMGKHEALAVCNGQTALLPGPDGLAAVPMQQALAAWKVG